MKEKEGGLMRQRKYELENGVGDNETCRKKNKIFYLDKASHEEKLQKECFIPAASIHALPYFSFLPSIVELF